MRSKKFFAKALAFAMVMGTVGVHGGIAAPVGIVQAAGEKPTIAFNAATYEATITVVAAEKSGYVCLQVLKENKADAKIVSEAWYPIVTADGKSTAVVDLSFLKAGKTQYIRAVNMLGVKSDITEIAPQPKTVVKYDAKTQKFVDKSKTEISDTDLANYEYKTLYGSNWGTIGDASKFTASTLAAFKTDKLQNAAVNGTTIVVRQKANTSVAPYAPAGTEVKIKIQAIAKAPKVKVDYVKGIITLPKNAEIVMVDSATGKLKTTTVDGAAVDNWTKAEGKLTSAQLLDKLGITASSTPTVKKATTDGYTFAVRTAEVEGKKAASKIDFVTINAAPLIVAGTLNTTTHVQDIKEDKTESPATLITCTMLADGEGMKVKPADGVQGYVYSLDGKKWIAISGEVTIKLEDKASIKIYKPAVKGDTTTDPCFASNVVEVQYISYTSGS